MLIGVHRTMINEFITRLLRDESDAKIRAALQRALERGYGLIRSGASGYGIKGSAG